MQTNSQYSDHLQKNNIRDAEVIDIGIIGDNTTIGMLEAVRDIHEYTMSCKVISSEAEIIKVKKRAFVSICKSNSYVWQLLNQQMELLTEHIAERISTQKKMQSTMSEQYKSLIGDNTQTTWQFGQADLVKAKAEYDKFVAE